MAKAAQNCEIAGRTRKGRPLTTWVHIVEQAIEKFELTDKDSVDRDRRSSRSEDSSKVGLCIC